MHRREPDAERGGDQIGRRVANVTLIVRGPNGPKLVESSPLRGRSQRKFRGIKIILLARRVNAHVKAEVFRPGVLAETRARSAF